ncbi:hypothetical protein C7N43_24945 [Sphingobacteriales bacterium UPWRP_1]|nr:hypothetical protein BVG80_11150 [Sphingobacteriales bacterium TSM_CSM]PSJ74264.1 hypothetical protein C7N43_24945 [Sphingobacteriales bacterium UPWRP_1]
MQFSIKRLLLCLLLTGSVVVGKEQPLKAGDFTIILIGLVEPGIDFTPSYRHIKVQEITSRQVSIAPIDHNNTFYAGLNPGHQYRIALIGQNGKEVSVKFISTYNIQDNEVIYMLFRCNT